MPRSKFCISFTLTTPDDAAGLSMQEFILDLRLRNRVRGTSDVSEAHVATSDMPPKCPDTASEACIRMGSPLVEQPATGAMSAQDPATSTGRGSFTSDWNSRYPHKWPNMEAFHEWCWSEECAHTIEFTVAKVKHGTKTLGRTLLTTKHVYRCTCQRIGQKADQNKHSEWQHKVPRKGMGCLCQIIIKHYPHTPIVLGRYVTEHNHELGTGNMMYMHLSDGAWEQMRSLLIQKVDTWEIVHVNLIFDQQL